MWDSTAVDRRFLDYQWIPRPIALQTVRSQGSRSVVSHICQNRADTRISCTRSQKSATCAAFIKKNRMEFLEANQLHSKYGVWGTHHLLAVERGELVFSI
jgi:hypothetical protein